MPEYVDTQASIHVKLVTEPPLPDVGSHEFYWQGWSKDITGFTFKIPPLPEGTRLTALRFTYVPAPTPDDGNQASLDLPA